MQQAKNLTLPHIRIDDTTQILLSRLLDLTLELHALDQGDQPSDAVERKFQHIHRELISTVQLDQPFQVMRDGQMYLISLSPVGVTYQCQGPLKGALQATA